jgi:hypothetical protein
MLTFEQFYKEFLTEAKYLPGVGGIKVRSHDLNTYYHIKYNNGNYTYEIANNETNDIIGTIVPKPSPLSYASHLRNLSITAALGVYERPQNAANINRPTAKIYAFHIAKYKLDPPGADKVAEDKRFYTKTLNDTAALLRAFIDNNGGDNRVSVIYPHSSNKFNRRVCKLANVQQQNVLTKYTYREAAQNFWSDDEKTRMAIDKFSTENKDKVLIYGVLRYIAHALANEIEILNLEVNPFVSLDRLASRIAYIASNADQLQLAVNYLNNNNFTRNEALRTVVRQLFDARLIRVTLNADANAMRKSYILPDLKAIYFKNLPNNIELHNIIAVVDDNINSAVTYNAVKNKLPQNAKVEWIVGIVPLENVPLTPNEIQTDKQRQEKIRTDKRNQELKDLKKTDIKNIKVLKVNNRYTSTAQFDTKEEAEKYKDEILRDTNIRHLKITAVIDSSARLYAITFKNNPIYK